VRRPGRFDREILIQAPDKEGRREILNIHTRNMPLGKVNLDALAAKTHGFVGADLMALCQEAGYNALKRALPGLEDTDQELTEDFFDAVDVIDEDFNLALAEMRPASSRNLRNQAQNAGWEYVAGYKAEKEFIDEMILWPARNFDRLSGLGVSYLDGLLISGPSGVGKTLMARSLAKESEFNIIEIQGPEIISKYMGESERNVRELFRQAREMAPSVVILDGADAMTTSSASGGEGARVIDRVVNQLAMELGALNNKMPVIVVAICDKAHDLPPSLRSTGRFGAELPLRLPRPEDREEMLRMFLNTGGVSYGDQYDRIVPETEGLSGGDIKEICRRAVLHGVRQTPKTRGKEDLVLKEDDVLGAIDRWRLTKSG
jgi:transitional endoplasmic reticulum ATPase